MNDVDHTGVHATHCCPNCGCKYGDPNCPVLTKLVEPVYECEECPTIGTVVLVNNTPVAWFKNFNEDAREWCSENYFGQWLTWPAYGPEIIPLTEEEEQKVKMKAEEIYNKLQSFMQDMKPLEPEFQEILDKHLWDLL